MFLPIIGICHYCSIQRNKKEHIHEHKLCYKYREKAISLLYMLTFWNYVFILAINWNLIQITYFITVNYEVNGFLQMLLKSVINILMQDFDPVRHVLEHVSSEENELLYFEKQVPMFLIHAINVICFYSYI
jgi:hypothetical protein